jgi:hypothetical protein
MPRGRRMAFNPLGVSNDEGSRLETVFGPESARLLFEIPRVFRYPEL